MTPFQTEVADRFGVLPNFFCTAAAAPGLVDELWGFARSAYLDSALPSLFKERLFVQLSRFCEIRYCIVRHVGFLVGLGRPAGDPDAVPESVDDVIALLSRPMPDATQLTAALDRLMVGGSASPLPEPGTQAEGDLFDALTVIFVEPARSARAREAVRAAVGDGTFEMLAAYLAFVRTAHFWTETHPELAFEPDMLDLMEQRPDLQDMLLSPADAERVRAGGDLRRVLAELHQTEAALRESETRNRLLVESWAQAMWETDAAGVVVADSPSWRAYTGQTQAEWLGYGWLDAIHPDDRAYAERQWRDAVAARDLVNAEFRLCAPDGTWHWTNVRAAPVIDDAGNIEKWAGINVDINERKRTEAALRESEERRELALEATQVGTFVWHVQEDRGEPDARMLALFDQPPSGGLSLATALATMIHPDDGAPYAAAVAHASDPAGSGRLQTDIRVRRSDGSWRWLEITARVSFGQDDRPIRMAGTALDITDRKLAEIRQQESEERMRGVLDAMAEGFASFDKDFTIRDVNAETLRLDGRGRDDLVGRSHWDAFPGTEHSELGAMYRRVARTRVPEAMEHRYEWPDGRDMWLEVRGYPTPDDGVACFWRDITERKAIQISLQDSEARLRVLVAELQHRVRNILTVIRLTFTRTFEREGTKQDLADHFLGRLGAMARTQVALTRHAGRTADLEDLIRDELLSVGLHAEAGPVTLAGPEVELDHKTAESLAMALHELTTNALKYGALAHAGATLDVTWHVNLSDGGEPTLHLNWAERGVPAIPVRPARRGFGRELIEEALPYRLGAETRLEFRGGGVRCAISVPLGTERAGAGMAERDER